MSMLTFSVTVLANRYFNIPVSKKAPKRLAVAFYNICIRLGGLLTLRNLRLRIQSDGKHDSSSLNITLSRSRKKIILNMQFPLSLSKIQYSWRNNECVCE